MRPVGQLPSGPFEVALVDQRPEREVDEGHDEELRDDAHADAERKVDGAEAQPEVADHAARPALPAGHDDRTEQAHPEPHLRDPEGAERLLSWPVSTTQSPSSTPPQTMPLTQPIAAAPSAHRGRVAGGASSVTAPGYGTCGQTATSALRPPLGAAACTWNSGRAAERRSSHAQPRGTVRRSAWSAQRS